MIFRIPERATLKFANHADAITFWRSLPELARMFVGRVEIDAPMTEAQYKKLPASLREVAVYSGHKGEVAA